MFLLCITLPFKMIYVIDRPLGSSGVCDIPEVLRGEAEYTTASEGSMLLVPQLTAFHQSQAERRLAEHSC